MRNASETSTIIHKRAQTDASYFVSFFRGAARPPPLLDICTIPNDSKQTRNINRLVPDSPPPPPSLRPAVSSPSLRSLHPTPLSPLSPPLLALDADSVTREHCRVRAAGGHRQARFYPHTLRGRTCVCTGAGAVGVFGRLGVGNLRALSRRGICCDEDKDG